MSHTHIPPEKVDFDSYRKSLIAHLKSQKLYTDYDFEGSNWSVLIDILAYNAYNLVHYDSMVGNEAWIDTALLRSSLVSHATDLSYLPRSRISASCIVDIEVYPGDNPSTITLPKYYRFKSADTTGNTLYFVTDQDHVITRDVITGEYIFKDVVLYQGNIVEEFFSMDNITVENGITTYPYPLVISSSNIDINSLEVYVYQNESDTNPTRYKYAKNLSETNSLSPTFFLRGIYDDKYAIEFGDGVFGLPLTNGNQVKIIYRDTAGVSVQGNYSLSKTTDISGYSNIEIRMKSRVQGGFEKETIEELRQNAPKYFQTQDRAVTASDYQVIIKKSFPQIQEVHAFGGEEVQQYGKVMIVLKPYGITGIVPDYVKSQITQLLKTKNIVPEPIIIDPLYFYVGINGRVFYNGDITKLSSEQLRTNILSKLTSLNDNELGKFNTNIQQSLINDTIKSADSSITGSVINMNLIRRWTPQRNLNETLKFTSNNKFRISLDGEYRNSSDYTVISSIFQIWYNNSLIDVVVQDDGIGNLYYYQVLVDGRRQRIGAPIGIINYELGSIDLISTVYDYGNYISFTIKLRDDLIKVIQDVFLIMDGANISLDLERN